MKILLFMLLLVALPIETMAGKIIYLTGVESTESNYLSLVKEKGGDPLKITDFKSTFATRPALALLILNQALHAGGMDAEIRFVQFPNLTRCIAEVKRGKIPLLATDMWEDDFDYSVYKTEPFIGRGDFEKGIYTHKDSPLLKAKPDMNELLQLVPLTEMSWTIDIMTLKKMGFPKIETAPRYELLLKMMGKKRADFTLLEFAREPDMLHAINGHKLYPVKGIKVLFPNSRHFMVSKTHPDGKAIYEALERGLKILRQKGIIQKALYQAGLKDERVRNWKVIYSDNETMPQDAPGKSKPQVTK
ncbi:hypothetical protein [Maridesulfovibrio sp.]|uniref:hypothetical protein n=1 Tax=Maridesulfovibrio sp. TaxID=2795000 RepID=UPI002A187716|nr:hypothetical protein [Maridesulfovibrio sp.]